MNIEIERKFLVNGDFIADVYNSEHILQGYISKDPDRIVRVRIRSKKGYITIKGKTSHSGMSRYEFEKTISIEEANELMNLCIPVKVEKTRHLITSDHHTWEIDVFEGVHTGLIVAEIELKSEDEFFTRPKWLGREVTGDERYYNNSLSSSSKTPPIR